MSEKKVLATVEGREITEVMLIDYWLALASKSCPVQYTRGRKTLLNEVITQELIYLDAQKTNLDQDEEFKAELEIMKVELLKQYGLRKLLEDVEVSMRRLLHIIRIIGMNSSHRSQFKPNISWWMIPKAEQIYWV